MHELIIEMKNWINLYYGDRHFLIMAVIAYIYLFVFYKDLRRKLIYPCLLIAILLLNPILYKIIYRAGRYWRFFWMLPNGMIIATAITKLVEQVKHIWLKSIIVIGFMVAIFVLGTNVYKNGVFIKTQNIYKISEDTINVCDIILEDNPHPKCIMPMSLFSEVRQYSGDIELYYGRNAEGGYIGGITDEQKDVFIETIQPQPDYDYILSVAKKENCDYVVIDNEEKISDETLAKYNYIRLISYNSYEIYKYR